MFHFIYCFIFYNLCMCESVLFYDFRLFFCNLVCNLESSFFQASRRSVWLDSYSLRFYLRLSQRGLGCDDHSGCSPQLSSQWRIPSLTLFFLLFSVLTVLFPRATGSGRAASRSCPVALLQQDGENCQRRRLPGQPRSGTQRPKAQVCASFKYRSQKSEQANTVTQKKTANPSNWLCFSSKGSGCDRATNYFSVYW